MHGYSFELSAAFVAFGQRGNQGHPAPAKPLFGGRKRYLLDFGDLADSPTLHVVEDDRHPVDEWKANQRILEFFAGLSPFGDCGRVHRVFVVPPQILNRLHNDLTGRSAGTVDSQIVQNLSQPRPEGSIASILVESFERPQKSVLDQVCGQITVPGEDEGKAIERFVVVR
jgi:hypothetical protein